MRAFNINRCMKDVLAAIWTTPINVTNLSTDLLLFLMDGSGGVPTNADAILNGNQGNGVGSYKALAEMSFAYGMLTKATAHVDNTDVGYRATTDFLTLKADTKRAAVPTGFIDAAGTAVAVPAHKVFKADWINASTTAAAGTIQYAAYQGMNKCFAFNPAVSRNTCRVIGPGFYENATLTDYSSMDFSFNSPRTVDCFVFERIKGDLNGVNTFARFNVQYLNGSSQWVTLATTPSISYSSTNGVQTTARVYLQFAPVTATKFRLQRTVAHASIGANDGNIHAYFGNTDVAVDPTFSYPSTVYGVVVPHHIDIYSNILAGATAGPTGIYAFTTTSHSGSLSLQTTCASDHSTGFARIVEPALMMMDAGDLASSARIKLPTLNTDPLANFGFNSVSVDIL